MNQKEPFRSQESETMIKTSYVQRAGLL